MTLAQSWSKDKFKSGRTRSGAAREMKLHEGSIFQLGTLPIFVKTGCLWTFKRNFLYIWLKSTQKASRKMDENPRCFTVGNLIRARLLILNISNWHGYKLTNFGISELIEFVVTVLISGWVRQKCSFVVRFPFYRHTPITLMLIKKAKN